MATWLKRKIKKITTKDDTPVSLTISREEGNITVTKRELQRYSLLHAMLDSDVDGEIAGGEGAAFLRRSFLEVDALRDVWRLASGGKSKARLNREDFFIACKLVASSQMRGGPPSMDLLVAGTPLPLADFHYGVTPDASLGGAAAGEAAEFPAASIRVTVGSPATFGSGLDKHTRYQVTTTTSLSHFPRKEICVWRRFSDFEWLNTRLSLTFPAAVIPPFPEKRLVMNTDPEFVAARQAALEVYVEKVARHPRLGTSLDLLVFLDASDPGLEAAKSYIEAAAAESEDSLLDRGVDAAKALLGGGGGGVHEAELRPDDGYLADAAAHGVAFARLEKVVRSGEAAHAAGGASAAALTELGKAMMALGETERRYGGVVAATRASVLSGVAANAAFDAAAGGGGGALAALPPAPKVDAAAAAAFHAHNAKLAAQADGSIEGMFTADFSDPYSSMAAANAPRAAPPKGGEAATITSGRLGSTLSLSGSAAATVGDVLLASGGVLLEEAALWKSQLKSFGDAFHGPLRAEGDFARGLDEALARRADAVARVVDASAQLARRKNALLGLRPGAGDYHTKVGEAQAAVEKAETAVAARRSELETMTAVLKGEMDRVRRARHDNLTKRLATYAMEQAAASRARALAYTALVSVLSGEGGEKKREASEKCVSAIARRAASKVTRGTKPAAASSLPAGAPTASPAVFAST